MEFTGERFIPDAVDNEPTFQRKMYQEHLARYLYAKQFARAKRVLDVACGVGYGAPIILSAGARALTGLDCSSEAIGFAQSHYSSQRLTFVQGDAQALPFEDHSFDLVVSFETIEHLDSPPLFVKELRRVLTSEGLLLISTPRFTGDLRSAFHVMEFSHEDFVTLLHQHFDHVSVDGQNNYLASSVGPRADYQHLEFLSDPVPSDSDYFIAICSNSPIPSHRRVVVMDEDVYIRRLEVDVGILSGELASRTEELVAVKKALQEAHAEVDALRGIVESRENNHGS